LSALSRDQGAALQEITIEEFADGRRRIKFKVHDKKAAISELNHMNGWVIERQEVGKAGDFSHLSDEELDAQLTQQLKARGLNDKQIRNFLVLSTPTPPNYNS
jgi:hypothetical protein